MFRPRSRSSSNTNTPNSSPSISAQKKKHRLSMAGIANLFIRIRRFEDKALTTDEWVLSSGYPKTHPNVAEGAQDQNKIPVEQSECFVCSGGVNLITLLRITRMALMDHAERALGANSVVDEQCVKFFLLLLLLLLTISFFVTLRWECIISGPKPLQNQRYKVQVWALWQLTNWG